MAATATTDDLSNAGNRRAAARRAARAELRSTPEPQEAKDFSEGEHVEIEVQGDETQLPLTRKQRRALVRKAMPRVTRKQVRKAKQDRLHGR